MADAIKASPSSRSPGVVVDLTGEVITHGDALRRAARVLLVDTNGDPYDASGGGGGGGGATYYKDIYDRDATGNVIYEGHAVPGSATSDAAWQIKAFTYDAQNNLLSTGFAGGAATFDQVWADRAGLTYS